MTLDQLGGRRFLLTVISGAGTWVLCFMGKLGGSWRAATWRSRPHR